MLQSYIQTDGVVNIGNSDGALLDLDRKLTGIITAIASPDGVYAGYSFAIPVQVVKKTVDDFLKYGRANRGDFGAKVTEIDETRQISFKGKVLTGIVLRSLEANGSTAAAGMAEGDIITQIDNLRMESVAEFSEYVARSNPGQKVRSGQILPGRPGTQSPTDPESRKSGTLKCISKINFTFLTVHRSSKQWFYCLQAR